MADDEKPEALDDGALDGAQGGAIFATPAGGWGIHGSAEPNDGINQTGGTARAAAATPLIQKALSRNEE